MANSEKLREEIAGGIKHQLDERAGCWRTCSGCYETCEGYPVGKYPHSDIFQCTLGAGCGECGGIGAVWDNTDYSEMADWILSRPSPAVPEEAVARIIAEMEGEAENISPLNGRHKGCAHPAPIIRDWAKRLSLPAPHSDVREECAWRMITMGDVRLVSGEGRLTVHEVLRAVNIIGVQRFPSRPAALTSQYRKEPGDAS